MTRSSPNPGSWEAIDAGCCCPVFDNAHGRGRPGKDGEVLFVYNHDCPVHVLQSCSRCSRVLDVREDVISMQDGAIVCQRCST